MSGRVNLAMLALVVIWGFNFPIVKGAFDELPPLLFNALRFGGATLILLLVLGRLEPDPPARGRVEWLKLFALGIVGHSTYQLLFINGLARTTAGNSAIILSTVPLFVALLGTALKVERLSARTWTGIVLAFAGIVTLVSATGKVGLGGQTRAGDLLMLLCTICWSLYTVFSHPMLRAYSPLRLTTLTMVLGSPVLILAALPQMLRHPWGEVGWRSWGALTYSAVLAIALGYVVWYASVRSVGNTATAVYSNLIPVVALVSAWLLLREAISPLQGAGAAVVLAGVSLARSGSPPPTE